MRTTPKRITCALVIAGWLYFLLPATATLFYELYHLTGIGAIYWGYSGFKAAGYYFGIWKFQWLACIVVAGIIIFWPGRKPQEP
ncbi:MAG: hypothetical protein HKN19_02970 [Halioglobus sp.]|nr:hypothetical protein [Halioglobus sp.]